MPAVDPIHRTRTFVHGLSGIFLLALAIRWLYALTLYLTMGDAGLMAGDSFAYLSNAQSLAEKIMTGSVQGWELLGSDIAIMPLFPWLLTANVIVAGKLAPLTTILIAGALDAGTSVIVAKLARILAPRFALPAGLAACLNPTQIVLSSLLYTDTPFVFFAALSLYGAARWYRTPDWPSALIAALGLGLAAATRALIVPWVPVVLLFLLAAVVIGRRLRPVHFAHGIAASAIVLLCLAPVLARNISLYNAWALTPQGGAHLALWVVPLIKESQDGTPWATGSKAVEARIRQLYPEQNKNPFQESERYTRMGRELLLQFGPVAIAKAWLIGAALNLGAPATIESPPVSTLPRTGFYDTKGNSKAEKILNFLFHSDNARYAWILLIGICGVGLLRLVQAAGVVVAVREPGALPIVLMLALWFCFILTVNGPIAAPKYRLPIEPVLSLLTGIGAASLYRWKRGLPD